MAEENNQENEKKSPIKLILMIVGGIVLLGGGIGVGMFVGGGDETDESFREEKIKKPKRRLRTRSGDGDEIGIEKVEALQDEPKESSLTKEESNSSLGKEPKRKQERERTTPTRSKSKGKLRKPPSRSKSKKDEDGTKDVRKRYKKKIACMLS